MSWWTPPRRPEPEYMEEPEEVSAYSSAASKAYLSSLDEAFAVRLIGLNISSGRALDVGSGPGSILLRVAQRAPDLTLAGIDGSAVMISSARRAAAAQGIANRVMFCQADAARLPFPENTFDLIWCNSVLHHLGQPLRALAEIARVARAGGSVLLRDLRRPSRLALRLHIALHGRHYAGRMKKLYGDSVRAAYTRREFEEMVRRSALARAEVFARDRSHVDLIWKKERGA